MQIGTPGHPLPPWFRVCLALLRLAACVLVSLALVSAFAGSPRVRIGPLGFSATHPARLFVEAFALFLVAHLVSSLRAHTTPRSRLLTLLPVLGLLVSLAVDSTPRRVGDGGEYMLMAFQLAHGRPPAVTQADLDAFSRVVSPDDRFRDVRLPAAHLRGHDGRYDFVHFWLYSLLAAPWVRLSSLVGAHPNTGFTVLNLLLLAGVAVVLAARLSPALIAVLMTGPVVWWTDKAHTEVLSVAALTLAVVLIDEQPWWAVVALAVAGAQNPPIALAALAFAVFAAVRGAWRDRRFLVATAAAALLCALHPAYYLWHLGRLSPLESVVTRDLPGLTALATPLLDPNIGILGYYPAFTLLAAVGVAPAVFRRRALFISRAAAWALVVSAVVFLVAFAETPNVNHGGTFNPSRYGLWLLPLAIPLVRFAEARLGRLRPIGMTVLSVFAVAWCCYVFAPRWPEHLGDSTTAARLLYEHAPTWYNPLPEVFAERMSGSERVMLPLASDGCAKVLLAGDGTPRPSWPFPCTPQDVPASCRAAGALCYANGRPGAYRFAVAPRQAGFWYEPPGGGTWKDVNEPGMRRLLERLGTAALDPLPAGKPRSFIADAHRLPWNRTWQGQRALVSWMPAHATDARLRVVVPAPGTATWLDWASGNEIGRVDLAPARDTWLSVPDVPAPVLLVELSGQ